MTDSLRDRIAAVHQAHRWGVFRCDDGYARTCCRCQWREIADGPTHAEHVADAVIAELGLREELRYPYLHPNWSFTPPQRLRYVTEWETTEKQKRVRVFIDHNEWKPK